MKAIYFLIAISLSACNGDDENKSSNNINDSVKHKIDFPPKSAEEKQTDSLDPLKSYSNARFKEVTVEKTGERTYTIQGKGQIFEASFGWVVEDGHNELQKGFQMTDAGAPEWGEFKFSIEVQKQRPNSTLTLILFESSPKDGSRQHELPIVIE